MILSSQGGTVQGQTLHVLDIQNAMPPLWTVHVYVLLQYSCHRYSFNALLTYGFYILKAFSCQDKLSIDLNFLKQQTKLQVVLPS